MIGKFFSGVQKVVNNSAGNNYRDVYFKSNPGDLNRPDYIGE